MPRPPKFTPKSTAPVEFFKIANLTQDLESFSISGRLLSRSEINPASSLLSTMRMLIGDETGTIVGVAFQEVAAKLYSRLKPGNCYSFECHKLPRGIKLPISSVPADMASFPGEQQIMFNYRTLLKESNEGNDLFPAIKYESLCHIKEKPARTLFNLHGVIVKLWDAEFQKDGNSSDSRDFNIVDASFDDPLETTIWGNAVAQTKNFKIGTVVRLIGATKFKNDVWIGLHGSVSEMDITTEIGKKLQTWFKSSKFYEAEPNEESPATTTITQEAGTSATTSEKTEDSQNKIKKPRLSR